MRKKRKNRENQSVSDVWKKLTVVMVMRERKNPTITPQSSARKKEKEENNQLKYYKKMKRMNTKINRNEEKNERIDKIMENPNKTGIDKLFEAIFQTDEYRIDEILHFKKIFDPFDIHTQVVIGKPDTRQRERVLDIFFDKELGQYITILTNHNKLRTK